MSAIFVSDVHLKDGSSVKTQLMIRFFQQVASGFEQIYILGDLFDAWPGTTDYLTRRFRPVLDTLGGLVRDGHQVHYLEGNHDFRLGKLFTDELGIRVHPDFIESTFSGRRTLMVHGDMENPHERGSHLLRGFLRNELLHLAIRPIPQPWIFALGRQVSHFSRKLKSHVPPDETRVRQVYRDAAQRHFAKGYDVVLMGHTHLPDHLTTQVSGRHCDYYNLGDWLRHFTYLEFDGREFYTRTHPVKTL